MFICSAYRPPELPLSKCIEELNKDFAKIPENAEIVLLDDFNVDFLNLADVIETLIIVAIQTLQ